MGYTEKELSKIGYGRDQISQIIDGQNKGVDVSLYMNTKMYAVCMFQIKTGLVKGLDVSLYSDLKYDWFQMEEIRLGLENNLDVAIYADSSIPFEKMRRIRLGLMDNLDLREYLCYPAGIIEEIHYCVLEGIDVIPFVEKGYNAEQLSVIRKTLANNIDVSPYISTTMQKAAIEEIVIGLKNGLDVSKYSSDIYNHYQMAEIRQGLESNVDVSLYINPLYNWEQMKEIRKGLENGLDVSRYNKFIYTAKQMERIRFQLERKISREKLIDEVEHEQFGQMITDPVKGQMAVKTVHYDDKAWRESDLDSVKEDLVECQEILELLLDLKEQIEDKYEPEVRNTMNLYLKVEKAVYIKKTDISLITRDLEALWGGADYEKTDSDC